MDANILDIMETNFDLPLIWGFGNNGTESQVKAVIKP